MTELILGFFIFVIVVADGEGFVQVMGFCRVHVVHSVGCVAFAHFLGFIAVWVGFALCLVSLMMRKRSRGCDLHKMLLLDLVPSRSTLFACSHTLNLFCLVIFHHEIYQLAIV